MLIVKHGSAVEIADDFPYSAHKAGKRWARWFVCQSNCGFVQQYIDHKKRIAFCYLADISGSHLAQDGFVIEALDDVLPADANARGTQHMEPADFTGSGKKPFVLAENIQCVHGPNGIIPSLVRFQQFDFGDFGLGEPPFTFNVVHKREEIDFTFPDREMRFGARLYAIPYREGRSHKIESASARINDPTDTCRDLARERRSPDSYREVLTGLHIMLGNDFIWATSLPLKKSCLDDLHLGCGPLE
jgi:hypothetical protein